MTAVALRCEFFEGSIEFDGILGLDRVGKLVRQLRNGTRVCSGKVRKECPRILQGRFHLRQFVFGERPVSEIAR